MEASPASVEWSADQRASEPFVFRSGGLFGSGTKVMTIGAAVRRMDRHPDDGIYHLQNGTLAQWLHTQGADDLARLARDVLSAGYADPRVMLETFLLGTGLVRRPRISLRPKTVNMGYALAGDSCSQELRIRKGRGRGYVFGRLRRGAEWLSLDPTGFTGGPARIQVTVDTRTLPISAKAQEAAIAVESSASAEPLRVPVRLRVMALPSRLNRFAFRPLLHLLVGAAVGGGLGWLLGWSGLNAPGWLPEGLRVAGPLFWAALVGLLWAAPAAARGFLQPLAWPTHYTVGRWLLRALIWAATLVLIALLGLWLWRQLQLGLGFRAPINSTTIIVGAAALAALPGILGELWNTRMARGRASVARQIPLVRPGLIALTALALCAALAAGARLAAPILREQPPTVILDRGQTWSGEQMSRFDKALNDLIDRFYLRMYDRRAPAPDRTDPAGATQ